MRYATALALLLATSSAARADVVVTTTTFESVSVPSNPGYIGNSDPVGNTNPGFTIDGNNFSNEYNATWGVWSGFAVSNKVDMVNPALPDYTYQYSTIAGGGAGGSSNFALSFGDSYVNVADGRSVLSMDVTNTTYAYLSMANGDQFSKKFGAGDFFKLTITGHAGLNGSGAPTGKVDFYLANFLGSNSYIVNTWQTVDLTGLGSARSLTFGLSSSDNGDFGMNTPAYFAMDDFRTFVVTSAVVPEPAGLCMAAVGFAAVSVLARRDRGRAAA
jgi:hypothetical protein